MKRWVLLFLCMALFITNVGATSPTEQTARGLCALSGHTGSLLRSDDFPAGTSVCDWTATALALSRYREDYRAYLRQLENYVEEAYAADGYLDRVKATTYHRIALTVLALGGDPQSFGTKSDGTPIDLIADGTYDFHGESLGTQGLNGWVYALLVLDASGVAVPNDAKFTRADMLEAILAAQEDNGGFGLQTGQSDADVTAMALQALAPYRAELSEPIDRALNYLSEAMNESCRFTAYGTESAETSAQAVMALCFLGIDPENDARFRRGTRSLLDGLADFRLSDGTYGHSLDEESGNYLATAQALLALTALERFREGQPQLFDFTEAFSPNQSSNTYIYLTGAVAAATVSLCIFIFGRRKSHGKTDR